MYSTKVIEANVAKVESSTGVKLVRHDPAHVEAVVAHLEALRNPETGELKRALRKDERAFITNERLLGMLDFRYWAERYARILLDSGGLGPFIPWDSQLIVLAVIAKLEEQMVEHHAKGEPVDGILIALHKARQLGATALFRVLLMHRLTTTPHLRALTASINEDKVVPLTLRDERIIANLPWWLKPSTGYNVKAQHRTFDKLDSMLLYQDAQQVTGLGQGEQFELGHLTECASWPNPLTIEHDYFPTIPQSRLALHGLESTAQGRGNWWHDFIEQVRAGWKPRWRFVFIPWYAEPSKYRRLPPDGWSPTQVSLLHAQKVHDTSPEFVGRAVMLSREQLYWWESTRAEYQKAGSLALFLTNYCATPEESFQHTSRSAFPAELLDDLRLHARAGVPYELIHATPETKEVS